MFATLALPRFAGPMAVASLVLVAACGQGPVTGTPSAAQQPPTEAAPIASAPPSTVPRDTASDLAARGVWLHDQLTVGDGQFIAAVVEGGDGQSEINIFDVTGTVVATLGEAGNFTPACGLGLIRQADRHLLLTMQEGRIPAAGIEPEQYRLALNAWDAGTAGRLWSTPLVTTEAASGLGCHPMGTSVGGILTPSDDGRWARADVPTVGPVVVDLTSGTISPAPDSIDMVGNVLVESTAGVVDDFALVDPATSATVGRVTGETAIVSRSRLVSAFGAQLGIAAVSSGDVSAIDLRSGAVRWTAKTPGASSTTFIHPDPVNNLVHVFMYDGGATANTNGTVYALDEGGNALWSRDVSYVCGVADGKLIVTANKQLAVLDGKTGDQVTYTPSMSNCPVPLAGALGLVDGKIQALF